MSDGEILTKIKAQYGTPENFITAMSNATVGIQGSGWGWLGYDKANDKLVITTLPNQDPLQAVTGLVPLLGIDVWEHAYYLVVSALYRPKFYPIVFLLLFDIVLSQLMQYKNARADYVKNIWKIVNWADVERRLIAAKAS